MKLTVNCKSAANQANVERKVMKKVMVFVSISLFGILLLANCGKADGVGVNDVYDSVELSQQPETLSETEAALETYSSFMEGDLTFFDDTQLEMWWIPDFQDKSIGHEYTCLDLDGDGIVELLVQMVDDPCGYNAVFHYEDGKLFCWNSDVVEMSCRDYPLKNGLMVTQYDYNGTVSYNIFRYTDSGEKENITSLFVREELVSEESTQQCPYYEVDGKEVDQAEFEEQLKELVTDRMLGRSAWKTI